MAAAFREHLPDKVSTPYPVKSKVNKDMIVDENGTKQIHDKGYRRAVGMVLWAARRSFIETKIGVSISGSVMHKANAEAFDNVMWIIKWMEQQKHRGIRFSLDGNRIPVGMTDASNKPVMSTGLCQAGFALMWLNGPMASDSRRLNHVGLSSEHNEYMALCLLIKKIIWFRQLVNYYMNLDFTNLSKIQLLYTEIMYKQIVCACKEHFVSLGNQYIAQQYHFK